MLSIVIVMIVILAIAGVVLAYVAYPHHGDALPAPARRIGEALAKATEAAPTIDRYDEVGLEHRREGLFE